MKKQKRTHTRCCCSAMRPCVWRRRREAVMVNTAKVNNPQQTNSSTVCSILHTVFTFSSPAAWCVCVNNDCPLSYVLSWQDLWHCYTVRENFTTGGCGGLLDGCNKTILLLVWAHFSFYHLNKQNINVHISTHFFKLPNAAIWTLFKKNHKIINGARHRAREGYTLDRSSITRLIYRDEQPGTLPFTPMGQWT